MRRPAPPVLGVSAPPPRPTGTALRLVLLRLALPALLVLLFLDVALWLSVKLLTGACIGLWCGL